MMQSILLSTPSNSQASERVSVLPAVDKQAKSDESAQQEGELAGNFSDLLGSAIAGSSIAANEKAQADKKSLDEEELEELEELEEVEELGSEQLLDLLSDEADSDLSAAGFTQLSTEQHCEETEESVTENELLLENREVEASDFATVGQSHAVKPEEELEQPDFNEAEPQPILAQIEAAQKMDAQLADPQQRGQSSAETTVLSDPLRKEQAAGSVGKATASADSASLKKDATEKELINGELKTTELEPLTTDEDKPLKTELPLQATDKQNQLQFTNHSEADSKALSNALDGGLLRSTNVNPSSLEKLVNQNVQNVTTSSALQQPLDIQAKHASALLGERVLMMINQGKQEVQIRLDPAELGSMYIKLQVQQEQLHLSIQTESGQSREIIEQNLPRLREQLAQQGVSLGETSVEQHAQQQNSNQHSKNSIAAGDARLSNDSSLPIMDDKSEWIASKLPLPAQGIDYYA